MTHRVARKKLGGYRIKKSQGRATMSTVKATRWSESKYGYEITKKDGHEVMRILFADGGPRVFLSHTAEELLRGEKGAEMRTIIEDSIKAVLDKLTAN